MEQLLSGILAIVICGSIFSLRVSAPERNAPLFCTLETDWRRVAASEPIGSFRNPDTLLEHQLYLLSDSAGLPLLFYADILTPVCIDGICKPVYIELYWDLVGEYAGFGVYEEQPLTKFDHDGFLPADYQKLHRLLGDNNSVLRRRKLSDLFDEQSAPAKKIEYQGQELDAVSGATRKEIRESIVEGALYSCYTLWHLVHGQATELIASQLDAIYDRSLEKRFLYTDHEPYYYLALKRMPAGDMEIYSDRLAALFATARPLTRTYLLKKIPDELLRQEVICRQFYEQFSAVDVNTRTLLLNKLPQANPLAIELLAAELLRMSRNQLKAFLQALPADESTLPPTVQGHLQAAARSPNFAYGYLIDQWRQ